MRITALKNKIIESGLKQCVIADAVGVEETLMSKYVAGRRHVPQEVQKRIAKFLKCRQGDLFPAEQ